MAAGNTCVWLTDLNLQEALSELEYHKTRQDLEASMGLDPAPFLLYLAWTEPHSGHWVKRSYFTVLFSPVIAFVPLQWLS